MAEIHVPITWSRLLSPGAWIIGAGRRSRLSVGEHEVTAEMGPLARVRFPRTMIADVRRIHWPILYGFGIRIYGRRALGLVGRRDEVVEIRLTQPVRARAIVPMRIERLAVSVPAAGRVVAALAPPGEAPKKPRPRTGTTRRGAGRKAVARRPVTRRATAV